MDIQFNGLFARPKTFGEVSDWIEGHTDSEKAIMWQSAMMTWNYLAGEAQRERVEESKKEPTFSVEDMRRLNCMDYSTFCYMMSWREDGYAEDKFSMMKNKGVSTFLMNLDNSKIRHVRSYLDQ